MQQGCLELHFHFAGYWMLTPAGEENTKYLMPGPGAGTPRHRAALLLLLVCLVF